MPYIIEVSIKREIWDVIKTFSPVAGTIAGVVIGFFLSITYHRYTENRYAKNRIAYLRSEIINTQFFSEWLATSDQFPKPDNTGLFFDDLTKIK